MQIETGELNDRQLRIAFRNKDAKLCKWGFSNIAHKDIGKNEYGMQQYAEIVVTGTSKKKASIRWRDNSTGKYGQREMVLGIYSRSQYPEAAEAIEQWLDQ